MNRERAETCLRLLAEAEMRGAVETAPTSGAPWSADSIDPSLPKLVKVAQALTTVGALDGETAEEILADFAIAAGARRHSGPVPVGLMRLRLPGEIPFARARSFTGRAASRHPAGPDPEGPYRFLPVGVTIPFRHDQARGQLVLMSYAHTTAGARFAAMWWISDSADMDRVPLTHPAMLPIGDFTAADDRGAKYRLHWTGSGGPEWTGDLILQPEPPRNIRWLNLAAPGEPAARIVLEPGSPDGALSEVTGPETRETGLSAGEHLLISIAEQLLTMASDFQLGLRAPGGMPGPLSYLAAGLGEIVTALEAADALSPLSPVPGQLAALCASLRVDGHGITAPAAHDLPEPWLSLLAHYQRRKPDAVPAHDGYATVGLALPELDGIRLALLGLHNVKGRSVLHVLVSDAATPLPLSVWIHDSGGRWHAARQVGPHAPPSACGGEHRVRLQLVPPLAPSTPWMEVAAAGMSAEVRARVPLRWRYRR